MYSKEKHVNVSPQKRKIGMVFQDFALWPHMTIFENVAYGLRATGNKKNLQEKVITALENVQLGEHAKRYPHQLSGGQQQRIAIARAIANDPSIILMDEPLSALDASLRDDMRILLQSLVKKLKMTAIYVTHDQGEAMTMSDRVVVMNTGRVMQVGTPEEVYQRPANPTVASFVGRGVLIEALCQKANEGCELLIGKEVTVPLCRGSESKEGMVTAVIRPEQVSLSKTKESAALEATVETVSFLGERYEVSMGLQNSKYKMFAYSRERLAVGQQVFVQIDTTDLHVMENEGGIVHEKA